MAKTSIDARRHIREWSEFFRGGRAIANQVVESFLKEHRKNKYLGQSLKRLISRGLIRKTNHKFIPTAKGILFLFRIRNKNRRQFNQRNKWDGKWRLISFDVPVSDDSKRVQLRSLLKEFDFYLLQKSVWVCPNYLAEDFWKLIVHDELDKYCKVMLVEIIEGDEDLKKHFKLS